jgi:MoaA/NifB/PqqE/SkfB family radical SAM enzyme
MIDLLDQMGVAVLSVSGGGEPLLRDDFDLIVDHAAVRGLYVKLTSNGTMPRGRYERLLKSRVDEIGISLDGVTGHDLPFSHVGAPILATLRYLNDHLPAGKKLTINVTVSRTNRDRVQEILDYCAQQYPRARVWLNPVVVGEGALRTSAPVRTEPDYLRRCSGLTQLSPGFYAAGAEQQYATENFNWGCLAGDQFFDVKPNGDFWLCQDQPGPAPLNVLEPGFPEKRKLLDKQSRRNCSGCIYSCYYVVQQSFRARNWPDVALLWWQTVTAPGSLQRKIGDRFGWLAGLCAFLMPRLAQRLPASLLSLLALALALSG